MIKWLLWFSIAAVVATVVLNPRVEYVLFDQTCPPSEILPLPKGYTVICTQYHVKVDETARRMECYTENGEYFETYRPMGESI